MLPLSNVRVIDLSRLLPGPMCTWYLQGLGAEVIKVEPPGAGDYVRHVPPYDEDGVGAWFTAVNAGKKSVVLDLRSPDAIEVVRRLVAEADVLVEGFRPGVLKAMGLDPEELRRARPGLVIASITGFGQTGPWAQLPGHDLGYCAVAGSLALSARPAGVPQLPALPLADMAGGALMAALQISAALFGRERTGEGAWLDISMAEGVLSLMAPELTATAVSGAPPVPGGGALTGGAANYQIYACSDGRFIAFPPLEPKFWERFLAALGEAVPMEREALATVFATRPRDAWAELLADACVVPLLELDEVLQHPLHRARGAVQGEGRRTRIRPPFVGSPVAEQAPALGEHTESVLTELGLDPTPYLAKAGGAR